MLLTNIIHWDKLLLLENDSALSTSKANDNKLQAVVSSGTLVSEQKVHVMFTTPLV